MWTEKEGCKDNWSNMMRKQREWIENERRQRKCKWFEENEKCDEQIKEYEEKMKEWEEKLKG
jgi:hypothetical protein